MEFQCTKKWMQMSKLPVTKLNFGKDVVSLSKLANFLSILKCNKFSTSILSSLFIKFKCFIPPFYQNMSIIWSLSKNNKVSLNKMVLSSQSWTINHLDYLFLRLVYFFEFVVFPTSTISIDHYPRNHYFQKNVINRLSILQHYSQSLSFTLWFL